MSKVVVSVGENSSNTDEKEELPQVFGLLLLVYGFATELILEGLARGDFSPQGKTGDVEMDGVKDVELSSVKTGSIGENSARFNIADQDRLKAKGDYERWDTRGLIVLHSDLMLIMESLEMDTILFYQRYEYLIRVTAMLALEVQLVWLHPEWVKGELMLSMEPRLGNMVREPYNSSTAS